MASLLPKAIAALIDGILAREGGFVDHPSDPGGATRFGITQNVARAAGYHGSMRSLPESIARDIYLERYVEGPGFGRILKVMPRLAEELVDTGVNMGPAKAAEFLQRALNTFNRRGRDFADIVVDGRIGLATMGALLAFQKARGAHAEVVLLRLVEGLQAVRYVEIVEGRPASEDFMFGWILNRIGNVKGQ
jgi:lysozyme family protein